MRELIFNRQWRDILPLLLLSLAGPASAQSGENVLVVINQSSNISRRIGEYYLKKRSIPLGNVCKLKTTADEEIQRDVFDNEIEAPIAKFLKSKRLIENILYIVTTLEVPLKVTAPETPQGPEACSVDSELTLLYGKLHGAKYGKAGIIPNPFFMHIKEGFDHQRFPIYLVTRLAGYDFNDVQGIIDRSLVARNRGKFVFDLKSNDNDEGNNWLRAAANQLPKDRVVLDTSDAVLYDQKEVIGYAAWGSNDRHRKRRWLNFQWLPGAIVTEFVSENGRTFQRPPDNWNIATYQDKTHFFAGSPQTLAADYIHEGATGCSAHVYEPYLAGTPRPDFLFPAYYYGRNLAESYYVSIPALSWQNIVIGDPLCKIGRP